jgi:hypothetical protein
MKDIEPKHGDIVEVPWGNRTTVRARVREVYGDSHRHVVVILTPDLSDGFVSEETTLSVPACDVKSVASQVS